MFGSEAVTQTNVKFTSTNGPSAAIWRLPPGRAISLKSAQVGVVRVACGGVWATFDGPHQGPGNAFGDHLLEAGDMVELRPGERLVVEPARTAQEAQIEWRPAEAACAAAAAGRTARDCAPADQLVRAVLALGARVAHLGAAHGRAPA